MIPCRSQLALALMVLLACEGTSNSDDGFTGLDPINTTVAAGDAHNCMIGNQVPPSAGAEDPKASWVEIRRRPRPVRHSSADKTSSPHLSPREVPLLRPHRSGRRSLLGTEQNGQLGGGSAATGDCGGSPCATSPTPVAGNIIFTTLAASGQETCGLTADGCGMVLGPERLGQLGTSAPENLRTVLAVERR